MCCTSFLIYVCFQYDFSTIFFLKHLDKPADCSSDSVFPACHATTNAMDDIVLSVTLSHPNSLDCVEGFQIHYNKENKTVSLSSPTAQFTFSYEGGQPVQNEIVVHTLDYENRTGDLPCNFSIVGEFTQRILYFAKK